MLVFGVSGVCHPPDIQSSARKQRLLPLVWHYTAIGSNESSY